MNAVLGLDAEVRNREPLVGCDRDGLGSTAGELALAEGGPDHGFGLQGAASGVGRGLFLCSDAQMKERLGSDIRDRALGVDGVSGGRDAPMIASAEGRPIVAFTEVGEFGFGMPSDGRRRSCTDTTLKAKFRREMPLGSGESGQGQQTSA